MTHSFYKKHNGEILPMRVSCQPCDLDKNTPKDCGAILGHYDHLSQRVDLSTGLVVDYIPPQPSENHVWNTATKRWDYVKTDADIATDVRIQRDRLMLQCDWVVAKSQETDTPIPDTWKQYRKALRDITLQKGFPRNVEWPIQPS